MRLLLTGFLAGLAIGVVLPGCGPKYAPQPSIQERCQGEPICMLIGQEVAAEEAVQQPAYQAPPRRRVFLWSFEGTRPGPIGYIDY